MNIAYFVSPHGFGHAARSSAVMDRLISDGNFIHVFTSVPHWFFQNSLPSGGYEYHFFRSDVGLIQKDPFREDIPQTLKALAEVFSLEKAGYGSVVKELNDLEIKVVFTDISPIGVMIGQKLRVPVVLIENFTWDWIYQWYTNPYSEIREWVDYFSKIYQSQTIHIQTIPFCGEQKTDLIVQPISRKPRIAKNLIREKLGISKDEKMVLITMGGIPAVVGDQIFAELSEDFKIVFPVGEVDLELRQGNIIYLPHNHQYFHPDLVQASDLVIAKVGYSTIAEVYQSQVPMLYLARESFRESKVLEKFVSDKMGGAWVSDTDFTQGLWGQKANTLIQERQLNPTTPINGADQVMEIFKQKIESSN